jgi:transglutaminase-like putative cysteine protease
MRTPWHAGRVMSSQDPTVSRSRDVAPYLSAGVFVDSDDPDIRAFAEAASRDAAGEIETAVRLYAAVRDGIVYDPYFIGEDPRFFRASDCLRAGRGFCVPKAALLAAAARVVGIPARVGYADVRNHLSTRKLRELVGGDLFVWHGFSELYLDGRWVKATPIFNLSLCERFGVHPLLFDGRRDSLFHEYDRAGRRHMEYVTERGHYADVPFDQILGDFRAAYPRWLGRGDSKAGGDFAREAGQEP